MANREIDSLRQWTRRFWQFKLILARKALSDFSSIADTVFQAPNPIDATIRVSIYLERDGRRFVLLPISFVSGSFLLSEREKIALSVSVAVSFSLIVYSLTLSLVCFCARWSLFLPSIRRSISNCLYLLPIRRFERHLVQFLPFMDWPNRSNYGPLHFQGGWPNGKWMKGERWISTSSETSKFQ